MRAGEAREVLLSMCVGSVTGATGGHPLRGDAVLIDLTSAADRRLVGTRSSFGFLRGVVGGERGDGVIVELGGHAPHVAEGVGVATFLGAERLELRRQVVGVLAGESRELRL